MIRCVLLGRSHWQQSEDWFGEEGPESRETSKGYFNGTGKRCLNEVGQEHWGERKRNREKGDLGSRIGRTWWLNGDHQLILGRKESHFNSKLIWLYSSSTETVCLFTYCLVVFFYSSSFICKNCWPDLILLKLFLNLYKKLDAHLIPTFLPPHLCHVPLESGRFA